MSLSRPSHCIPLTCEGARLASPYPGDMTSDPTGQRFRLEHAGVTAEFAQVGAALRALTVGGVDLVPATPTTFRLPPHPASC